MKVRDLTEVQLRDLAELLRKEYTVEGELRRSLAADITRLRDIGCYRGLRHRRGLARAWSTHPHQRAHPQGTEAHRGR